jgi:hypothetical protein
MIEFEQGGKQYRAEKLGCIPCFHVSRKIAPLLPALIPVFLTVSKMKGGLTENLAAVAEVLQPFADGIAALPDEATEYVLSTCLSVVRRRQGDNWAPIWSTSAKAMMFDDIDLASALPIAVRVIQENLGPFISGLLTSQQETSDAPAQA